MRWLFSIMFALFLSACGGGHPALPQAPAEEGPVSACPLSEQQEAVKAAMARNYWWWDRLGTPDAGAPTISRYFDSLLNKPADRYSFSEPTATYTQRVEQGLRVGYGYTLVWADAQHTALRVRSVEPLGPAARAGLRRGHTIASIDGYSPEEVGQGQPAAVSVPGVARTIVLRDTAGSDIPINMMSAEYPLTIVPATATFSVTRESDGQAVPVGYLAYQSFVENANGELGDAMRAFGEAGVRELVLDLRYNGGGSVAVSRDLASMIAGSKVRDRLYAYLRFNENNLIRNQSILFRPGSIFLPAPALEQVERLIVLTSPSTASASELLVNALTPFMPVVLVGGTTYGKPYGSIVRHHCGTTYHAIQFTSLNANGVADFANGFTPDCAVPDDLDHAMGDPREARLAAALGYVKTGQCPAGAAPPRVFGARPAKEKADVFGEVDPGGMRLD